MKTFLHDIQTQYNDKVIKSYPILGQSMKFTALQFKTIMDGNIGSVISNSFITTNYMPTIVGTLKRISNSLIGITFKYSCDDCEGTGDVECDLCDGQGEHYCTECEEYHECAKCNGDGIFTCEKCIAYPHDEDNIIFYTEIDLNQGELF